MKNDGQAWQFRKAEPGSDINNTHRQHARGQGPDTDPSNDGCGDSRNAASLALHASQGFHPVGTLRSVGHKHGEWRDTVLMQRSLGDGDTTPPQRP